MQASQLPAALIAAYRATRYIVQCAPPLELRVDVPQPLLIPLLSTYRVADAAIVTAANPASEILSESDNTARLHALEAAVAQRGLAALAVENVSATGEWPTEAGLLVLGADAALGAMLGRQFGQNAVLTISTDAPPQLLLLR